MPDYIEIVDAELATLKLTKDKKKALETETVKEEAKAINSLVGHYKVPELGTVVKKS